MQGWTRCSSPCAVMRGDAEQLDAVAELVGERDVHGRDVADALDVDGGEAWPAAEGQGRQQRELVRGVDAVDVEGGVGLGVAQRLRLGQHVGEVAAGLAHRASGCSCRCR